MHQPTGRAAEGFAYATLKLLLFGVCIISWSCAEQQDDGDHQDGQEDEFRGDPLMDYCSCMLNRCHDGYHATWGEDHLASAATIEPRFIQARINLAVAYAEQGEAEAAKLELHTALHIAPRHRRVHLNMALLLLSGLLIDEDPETTCKTALIHLRTVVDISPDWAEVSRAPHPARNGPVTAP